jgi:hypothetical protein
MKDPGESVPPTRTWREIPQQVGSRAMSRKGRARSVFSSVKTIGALLAMVAAIWSAVEVVSTWNAEPKKIGRVMNSVPVKEIALTTDGVLDQGWVSRTLALPANALLMELDLRRLQQRLLETGQVRTAIVAKSFPATLSVTLSERSPVARLMARFGDDAPQEFLAARDGVVFPGVGYDDGVRRSLPWLTGVRLVRQGRGFAPIGEMEAVADLLAKARNEAPQLYDTWRVVDLSRLASDGEINVQSSEIERITFSTTLDYFAQIARLDYVRGAMKPLPRSVNLGLGSQVVAAYAETPAKSAAALPNSSDSSNARFVLPAFSNPQHRSARTRDL